MNNTSIKKFYYPNGNLRTVSSFNGDGSLHGVQKQYYKNGKLALETIYQSGVPDGIGRQWNETGDLLVEFEIKNGTGIQKVWSDLTKIMFEYTWVDGKWNGKQSALTPDDGETVESFWINNTEVSKKKYIEQCKINGKLPKYEE